MSVRLRSQFIAPMSMLLTAFVIQFLWMSAPAEADAESGVCASRYQLEILP